VIGDVSGCPGESLQIELSGDKAGYWKDWAAPGHEGKDLIGLYLASLGYDRSRDFHRALEEIAGEFLDDSTSPARPCRVTERLKDRARAHHSKPRPSIDSRPPPSATFTYQGYDGRVIGLVRRHDYDERDPKTGKQRKTFSVWDPQAGKAQAPAPRPLYRIPEIARASHVVFVEGEMKADALASCSIEATCIMFGANAPLDKVDWSPIAGRLVTVWPDADEAGETFASRVIPVLQALSCRVARVAPPPGVLAKWERQTADHQPGSRRQAKRRRRVRDNQASHTESPLRHRRD
jgi:putative DNA primase/helicase